MHRLFGLEPLKRQRNLHSRSLERVPSAMVGEGTKMLQQIPQHFAAFMLQ
jgi:hypothetical protein